MDNLSKSTQSIRLVDIGVRVTDERVSVVPTEPNIFENHSPYKVEQEILTKTSYDSLYKLGNDISENGEEFIIIGVLQVNEDDILFIPTI